MSDPRESKERGFIEKVPHHNNIFNHLENPGLTPILKDMILESSLPLKAVEEAMEVLNLYVFLKGQNLRGWIRESQFLPPPDDAVVGFLAQLRALRKAFQMTVLHAGVDERLRAVRSFLRRILCGIQSGGPGVLQDLDAVDRIAARGHGPEHFVDVGRIDVIVNRDNPFRKIRAARTLCRDRKHLLRVSRITLLERNDHHAESAGRGRMSIDSYDA